MNAAKVTILGTLILLSLSPFNSARAANMSFTADTEIELTGLDQELYALSGSEADSLEVSGSTLTVDIPADSTFTLGAGSPTHNVLQITPAGGSVTLTFDSSNFSGGYAGGWTLNSSTATSWTILFGVSDTTTTHQVNVNDILYNRFNANSQGEVQFTYTDGFTNKTFDVATWERVSTGGLSWEELQEYNEQLEAEEAEQEAQEQAQLKERIKELQLTVISLANELIGLLQERINVLRLTA
jgi:hypothetical protein